MLEQDGYRVWYAKRDGIPAGASLTEEIINAMDASDRLVAVLSPAYLASRWAAMEWGSVFVNKNNERSRLVPVRVVDFFLEGPLATIKYVDLVGADKGQARVRLLRELDSGRGKPPTKRVYPRGGPAYPVISAEPVLERPGVPTPAPRAPAALGASASAIPAEVDLLTLAFRLVVAGRAAPGLLQSLDPHLFRKALADGEVTTIDGDALLWLTKRLAAGQPGVEPNRLWLEWARLAHGDLIERLAKELPGGSLPERSA